ncbi:MAG: hypothetical protein LBE10_01695 [Treponema sp.]|nr:hypothetical protein [Treponema sp.]
MKKFKKIMATVILAALILGAAGCRAKEAPQASRAPAIEFPGGWKPTADYGEQVTISTAAVLSIDGYDYSNGDDFAKWYSRHFNSRLEVTTLGFENWAERLRIWISSGDMPDVVVFDYAHPDVAGWVEQGLLKKLPDNWKQRWPNAARVFGVTGVGPQMDKVFGGTYFLPRSRFDKNLPHDPVPNHNSFYMRKDWARAVGFPLKDSYTIPEIIEYGKLIKKHDPGNLGSKLIPITGSPDNMVSLFIDRVSTHGRSFYKDKDGVYKWGAESPDTLKGLKFFYEAYEAGVANPEFYTLTFFDDYPQVFIAGIAGGLHTFAPSGQLQQAWSRFQANVGPDPEESLAVVTPLGDDGYYHQEDIINFWGCLAFSPQIKDEVFERYMDMVDFGCTEKGYAMLNMGLEGIDWKQEPDGSYTSLLPEGVQLQSEGGKYPSVSDGYVLGQIKLYDDFSFEIPTTPKLFRDISWRLYKDRCELSTPDTFSPTDWTLYCFDSPSRRKTMFDYASAYSNIITSSKSAADVEVQWKKWIDSNRALVDPVLEELNNLK